MSKAPRLNRYTSLPVLLDMLTRSQITLLNPALWEDRNDSYYIEQYKIKRKLKTVLAACFSNRPETFHQWKVFANGSSGVCIEFDKEKFLKSLPTVRGIRAQLVRYSPIYHVEKARPDPKEWPFLKRIAFKDEDEFRIVYESSSEEMETKMLHFDISSIRQITLSPWLPKSVADTTVLVIKAIDGCDRLKVNRSSLIENSRWKSAIADHK